MKVLPLAALLAALAGSSAFASQQLERIPVTIRLVGDDGLTQKLTVGLRNELQRNRVLRPATSGDRDAISIESDSNADWDELSGRTVLIYTVYVFRGESRGAAHAGVCYEKSISKCVNAITRLVRIRAELP